MNNKKAVITGANRGIGKSYAMKCAQLGYDLILIARNEELLQNCSNEIKNAYHVDVNIMSVDLAKTEDLQELINRISGYHSIELLVNNAGFAVPSSFCDSDIEDQIDMVRVHDEAMLRLSKAVLPTMREKRKGIIINVASTLAYIPFVGNSVYCASKSFVNTFSLVLQREVKQYGIVIQALNPGRTSTDFHNTKYFRNIKKRNGGNKDMSPDKVVNISFKKLGKKVIVVPGLINKLSIVLKNLVANSLMKKTK